MTKRRKSQLSNASGEAMEVQSQVNRTFTKTTETLTQNLTPGD
jgi:hypothetical protein